MLLMLAGRKNQAHRIILRGWESKEGKGGGRITIPTGCSGHGRYEYLTPEEGRRSPWREQPTLGSSRGCLLAHLACRGEDPELPSIINLNKYSVAWEQRWKVDYLHYSSLHISIVAALDDRLKLRSHQPSRNHTPLSRLTVWWELG
jgi:hypothetical protein